MRDKDARWDLLIRKRDKGKSGTSIGVVMETNNGVSMAHE